MSYVFTSATQAPHRAERYMPNRTWYMPHAKLYIVHGKWYMLHAPAFVQIYKEIAKPTRKSRKICFFFLFL